MLNIVSHSVAGKALEIRTKNSQVSKQQTFQEVLSDVSGYDYSIVETVRPQRSIVNGLLNQAELIVPTYNNLSKMITMLNEKLAAYLKDVGINSYPPFDLKMNYEENVIEVYGNRRDVETIKELINVNDEIKRMMQQVSAIGSHVINIADSINFQKEYRESNNPESVITKYSYLFNDNRRMSDFSLRFNGELKILSDNAEWLFPAVNK